MSILPQIKHVVVLMMENRSLDNLLGWVYSAGRTPPQHVFPPDSPPVFNGLLPEEYWNATGNLCRVFASEGTSCRPYGVSATAVPTPDPGEHFTQMTEQIFNGGNTANMKGFLADYEKVIAASRDDYPLGDARQIMQSYSPSQVPVLSALATGFAVSDAWYASAPCQTWPNRGFVHTGSSDGHVNNMPYEPYDIDTIFNLLVQQGIGWNVYNDSDLPPLAWVMFPKLWVEDSHYHKMDKFYDACVAAADAPAADKLPPYSFVEPAFLPDASYHPPHDIRPAEAFLWRVYDALRQCPYRDDILFLITFDEHGGCYDHVPPPGNAAPPEPGAVSRDGTFHFDRFGVRVPTIVVSSYVDAGTVFRSPCPTPYDHTTILATLRDWLQIPQAAFEACLPSPRIAAAPTLAGLLDRGRARSWPDIAAPDQTVPETEFAPDTELDPLQVSVLIGATSAVRGEFIGADAVQDLLATLKTSDDARRHLRTLGFAPAA